MKNGGGGGYIHINFDAPNEIPQLIFFCGFDFKIYSKARYFVNN